MMRDVFMPVSYIFPKEVEEKQPDASPLNHHAHSPQCKG